MNKNNALMPWDKERDWKALRKETVVELGEVDALQLDHIKDMYAKYYGINKFKVFPGLDGRENKRFLKAITGTCDELKEKLEANGWQLEEQNGRRDGTYVHAAIKKYTLGSTFIIENKDPESDEKVLFKKTILPVNELIVQDMILTSFPDEIKKLPQHKIAVFGRYWKKSEKQTDYQTDEQEQPEPELGAQVQDLKNKAEKLTELYEGENTDPIDIAHQMQEFEKKADALEEKLDKMENKEVSSENRNYSTPRKIRKDLTGKWPKMGRKAESEKQEQAVQLGIIKWESARFLENLYKKHYGISSFDYKKISGDLVAMFAKAETYDYFVSTLAELGWKLEQRMEMPDSQKKEEIMAKYEKMKKEGTIASYDILTITTPTIDEEILLEQDIINIDVMIRKNTRSVKEIGDRAKMHTAVFARTIDAKKVKRQNEQTDAENKYHKKEGEEKDEEIDFDGNTNF